MVNKVDSGNFIGVLAPYDVVKGDFVLVGNIFGLANNSAANGAIVDLDTSGSYNCTVDSLEVWAIGDDIYWDDVNRVITNVPGITVGRVIADKPSGQTIGAINISGLPIDINNGSFALPVYNGDGTLASAVISGVAYTFTYSNGKLATATGGGKIKTYTWTGEQLTSVVVS